MECHARQLNKYHSALTAGVLGCSAKLMTTWPKAEATQNNNGSCYDYPCLSLGLEIWSSGSDPVQTEMQAVQEY